MKVKNIYYALFLVIVLVSIFAYFKLEREKKKENPTITDLALEPDLLINTADRSLHDHKKLAAIAFLDDAIEMMKLLEKDGDEVSMQAIEVAIGDLEIVEDHIKAEDINDDLMYEAFADAMNSLAFASLRVSEKLIKEGKMKEADITLEHAMDHLQNSIRFARGEQKEEELVIVAHLQKIMEEHLQNDISQIDQVMAEIDSVVKAHVIK